MKKEVATKGEKGKNERKEIASERDESKTESAVELVT